LQSEVNLEQKVDAVFSLGTNCEVSYNVRKYYNVERAGLLDWFIAPFFGVLWLIEHDFRIVGPDFANELEHVVADGTESILHAPSGILLHHAFSRDEKNAIVQNWRDEIPGVAEKYQFLGERMHADLQKSKRPALFLNRSGWHSALAPEMDARGRELSIYPSIISAFARHYPHAEPIFALMNPAPESLPAVVNDPRVVFADVLNHGDWHEGQEGHFAGCATGWRNALASLRIRSPAMAAASSLPTP
jgi:hypothetical protein